MKHEHPFYIDASDESPAIGEATFHLWLCIHAIDAQEAAGVPAGARVPPRRSRGRRPAT